MQRGGCSTFPTVVTTSTDRADNTTSTRVPLVRVQSSLSSRESAELRAQKVREAIPRSAS
eukprot:scaffold21735_cov37-Prasinocladus_malaysianus.AAC.1